MNSGYIPISVLTLHVAWWPFERQFSETLEKFQRRKELVEQETDVGQMWLAKLEWS